MSQELKLRESTSKLLDELARVSGKDKEEIAHLLLYQGLKSLDEENPDSPAGQTLLKLKNMASELELMWRPPGAPRLHDIFRRR